MRQEPSTETQGGAGTSSLDIPEPRLMEDEEWVAVREQAMALSNTHPNVYQLIVAPLLAEIAWRRR
jgi:hypothetical protein